MARRVMTVALVAALAGGGLVACGPSSSGASGTVVERERHRNSSRSWRDYSYTITVHEDGGRKDTGLVSQETYDRCQVGDRWPDCKRG